MPCKNAGVGAPFGWRILLASFLVQPATLTKMSSADTTKLASPEAWLAGLEGYKCCSPRRTRWEPAITQDLLIQSNKIVLCLKEVISGAADGTDSLHLLRRLTQTSWCYRQRELQPIARHRAFSKHVVVQSPTHQSADVPLLAEVVQHAQPSQHLPPETTAYGPSP